MTVDGAAGEPGAAAGATGAIGATGATGGAERRGDAPTAPLLVELRVEELPPKALRALGDAFADGIAAGLAALGLVDAAAEVARYATPRRLAVVVAGVRSRGVDQPRSVKLMPTAVGLDAAGQPTPALLRKLAALGLDAAEAARLLRRADGKAEALFHDSVAPGLSLADGLQRALEQTIVRLPIPKLMQYQLADGWTSVSFVRPAHGLVALHGEAIVPVRLLGLDAGRSTLGHRFEAKTSPIVVRSASSYASQLLDEGAVVASFAERRERIRRGLLEAAASVAKAAAAGPDAIDGATSSGFVPIDDDALLDEVTALVERPNVLACAFDAEFLAVPPECLVLTMKANQKYFPLLDAGGRLTRHFLVVANIAPADPARIVEGNERVVRPRLADARFFFEQDRKRSLASRLPELDRVVYHARLGSQGERVRRLERIAAWVAGRIGADVDLSRQAARLAKADLVTSMVGEFPELQGIMGAYYAAHDGAPADVVAAIRDQYVYQRGEGGERAVNLVGASLLIADRAESLVGLWSVGGRPTGDKDPYGQRRSALALIGAFESVAAASTSGADTGGREGRVAAGPPLELHALLAFVASTFAPAATVEAAVLGEVEDFVYVRYANQLAQSFDARAVDAVVSQRPALGDVVRRLQAVRDFQRLVEAESLAAANKRVGNILKKAERGVRAAVDPALLGEPAERALHRALADVAPRADARFDRGDYTDALRALADLRAPVDAFFETVMVNADDPALRANRLALLADLHAAMNRVADLSKLAA